MLIKLTEKCSMGCRHCMNDAKAIGKEMSLDVLKDSLKFMRKTGTDIVLIVTGGEPTEHSKFSDCLKLIIDHAADGIACGITVTTNGVWMAENPEKFNKLCDYAELKGVELLWQVTTVREYYPKQIDITKSVYRRKNVTVCTDIEAMYPQGRALTNKLPWQSKCSKCFNVRAIAKQVDNCKFGDIVKLLFLRGKMCTPHIKVNGDIGLGESDLCPPIASIYDDEKEIVKKIRNCKCNKCSIVNDKLPENIRRLLF